MAKLLVFESPRKIGFINQEDRELGPGEVRVATIYSGLSAGTDLTWFRWTNPKVSRVWDKERNVFTAATPGDSLDNQVAHEISAPGYSQVGRVVEVATGVQNVAVGDVVYGAWGHRSHAVISAAVAELGAVEDLDPLLGVFTRVGIVALNGVLDGQPNVGEVVAVFGCGVIGQLVVQFARLSGARVVVAEHHLLRRRKALELNPGITVIEADSDLSGAVRQITPDGADVCFEVAGSTAALHEAIRACAYSAKVVSLGFHQGESKGLYLGEEFHHNRVTIIASQISGQNPSLQHRWNRKRLTGVFIDYVRRGHIQLEPLITHRTPFSNAQEMFCLADEQPNQVLQAVFTFPDNGA